MYFKKPAGILCATTETDAREILSKLLIEYFHIFFLV